jgi:hypothetical protein
VAEQQTWSVDDDAVVRAALEVLRRDVQERPLADAAFVRARGDARRRRRRVTVALASAAAAVAVGYVGVQALVEPAGRVVGPVGRPSIAVSAPTGPGGAGATTGAPAPSVPPAVPGPLPVAQEYQRALGLRGRVVVSDLKESEGAVLDCPQVRSPGVRVAGQSVTSTGPGVYGDQAVYRATDPAAATRAATTLEQQLLGCPMLTVSPVGDGQGPPRVFRSSGPASAPWFVITRSGDRVGLLNVGQTPTSRTSRWTTAQLQDLAAVAQQRLRRDVAAPATTPPGRP